jgi:hypothetical protein
MPEGLRSLATLAKGDVGFTDQLLEQRALAFKPGSKRRRLISHQDRAER